MIGTGVGKYCVGVGPGLVECTSVLSKRLLLYSIINTYLFLFQHFLLPFSTHTYFLCQYFYFLSQHFYFLYQNVLILLPLPKIYTSNWRMNRNASKFSSIHQNFFNHSINAFYFNTILITTFKNNTSKWRMKWMQDSNAEIFNYI